MRPCPQEMHFGFGAAYPEALAHLTSDGKHHGEDFLAPKGTPIRACVDGIFYDKGYRGSFGFSVWIKFWIDYWIPWKRRTFLIILAHLSEVLALQKIGDKIRKQEIVGLSGASGSATQKNSQTGKPEEHPHLHLEVRELKNGLWIAIDPRFVTGV